MSPPAESVFAAFLVFCRVGGCLMMVPGFSSPRLPVRIRLLMALGVALAVMPLVHQQVMTSAAAMAAGSVVNSASATRSSSPFTSPVKSTPLRSSATLLSLMSKPMARDALAKPSTSGRPT